MKNKLFLFSILLWIGSLTLTSISSTGKLIADEKDGKKFSHKFHVGEQGIACADCHGKVAESKSSSDHLIPGIETCFTCHEKDTFKYSFSEIAKPEIIFNHVFHTGEQKIECLTCHKGIEQNEDITRGSSLPAMETCVTCHNNEKASNTCETCHTSLAGLHPKSHEIADFTREHKKLVRTGRDETCITCHSSNFCQDCHDAGGVAQKGKKQRGSVSPDFAPTGDGKGIQRLTRVHDLSFEFTHGIEAKSKQRECYTCHESRSFCVDCHQAGGGLNGSGSGLIPRSHASVNFKTFGVGSGGGDHARLAKKDIESCMTCHDTEGRDPACITCHFDPDGHKGTDPKTHPAGFMRDTDGDWHENANSMCYNCHTDANAHPRGQGGQPGVGFCGYCHGRK